VLEPDPVGGHNTRADLAGVPLRRRAKTAPASVTVTDLVRREFAREGPNQLWVTDIIEHPIREGTLYCCVAIDTFSRRVVGWAIDSRARAGVGHQRPRHGHRFARRWPPARSPGPPPTPLRTRLDQPHRVREHPPPGSPDRLTGESVKPGAHHRARRTGSGSAPTCKPSKTAWAHARLTTTEQYLHTLRHADAATITALDTIRNRAT
jgi:transposase InsO family protein